MESKINYLKKLTLNLLTPIPTDSLPHLLQNFKKMIRLPSINQFRTHVLQKTSNSFAGNGNIKEPGFLPPQGFVQSNRLKRCGRVISVWQSCALATAIKRASKKMVAWFIQNVFALLHNSLNPSRRLLGWNVPSILINPIFGRSQSNQKRHTIKLD